MKNTFILLTLFLLSNIMNAQEFVGAENIDEVKKVCEKITTEFEKENVDAAFEILRNIWFIPDSEILKLEAQTNKQLSFIGDRFGKSIGSKLVKTKLVEDVAIELTYVVKHEFHLLRFRYTFYKGKEDLWYLNNFKWDDSISAIFSDE